MAAALTVATVVRLALHARRDEIEIMQLVGAPQAYIRGPFVMEGILQGGIGATVALVLLAVGLPAPFGVAIWCRSRRPSIFRRCGFCRSGFAFLLLVGGMMVGCLGGFVASRRNLIVTES